MTSDDLEIDDPDIKALWAKRLSTDGFVLHEGDGPYFYAWCAPEARADAFVAALAALDQRGTPYGVELSELRAKETTHDDLALEDVRRLARAHLTKKTAAIEAYAGITLRSGEWLDERLKSRGEAYKTYTWEVPMQFSVYDPSYFFPIRYDFFLGAGPHAPSIEAAAIAIHTQADVEHILLGLCAPDAGLVTTGACSMCFPWVAHLEANATYHADAAAVARDLALSWIHLHDGYQIGLLVGLSLDELAARAFAAPEGTRVGIATSLEGVQKHDAEDQIARKDAPRGPPFSPFARKGVRPIRPGDEELSREQVLRAIATPPDALLDALEASAAALQDDVWRAAEPLARQAIEARLSGGPTYELLHTVEHRRLIEQHAPYHVRKLPNGGVLLATHPFRTLWPLWADALALLGIRPRGGG
jgi:hypothetical protein